MRAPNWVNQNLVQTAVGMKRNKGGASVAPRWACPNSQIHKFRRRSGHPFSGLVEVAYCLARQEYPRQRMFTVGSIDFVDGSAIKTP